MKATTFILLWLFIAAVSAIDTYLLVLYAPVLIEQNPVGRLLIQLGGVPLFAALKLFGTTIALGTLLCMYDRVRYRVTASTACGVALCQFLLLLYLVFA